MTFTKLLSFNKNSTYKYFSNRNMAAHEEVYEFHLVHAIITQTQNIDGLFIIYFIIRC